MLRSLHVALIFMTTLPMPRLKDWRDDDARRSVRAYPLVGLILGLMLTAAFYVLSNAAPLLRGALLTALWLVLTGALHFDGFCDMADAAFSAKLLEERQRIAKDTHIGAFALATGVMLLLVKVAAVSDLANAWWLVVALVLARTLVVAPLAWFEVHADSSLGRAARISRREALLPLCLGLLLSLGFGIGLDVTVFLLSLLGTVLVVLALAYWLKRRLAGLGGDAYGALIETSEATFLICISLFA